MSRISNIELAIRAEYEAEKYAKINPKEGLTEVSVNNKKCVVEVDPNEFREAHKIKYNLYDILFCAFIGAVYQYTSYTMIAEFTKCNQRWLRKYTNFPEGKTPSKDTFRRVISMLNPEFIKSFFKELMLKIIRATKATINASHVALDGKSVVGYYSSPGNRLLHTVSTWSSALGISLDVTTTKDDEGKEIGEIKAAEKLLQVFDAKGKVITGDAGFCYKQIAQTIVNAGGDWIFALKGNQKTTFEAAKKAFSDSETTFPQYETNDHGHGRSETRIYQALDVPEEIKQKNIWANVNSIVKVTSTRITKKTSSFDTRFYLSSLPASNLISIAGYIRSHWSIENNLHWTLDVVFHEDKERCRNGFGPENLLVLRRAALSAINGYARTREIKSPINRVKIDPQFVDGLVQLFFQKSETPLQLAHFT